MPTCAQSRSEYAIVLTQLEGQADLLNPLSVIAETVRFCSVLTFVDSQADGLNKLGTTASTV